MLGRLLCRSLNGSPRISGIARCFAAEAAPSHDDTLTHVLAQGLEEIKAAGTYKREFPITSCQGPSIRKLACCVGRFRESWP
jgi:hypothetical protein